MLAGRIRLKTFLTAAAYLVAAGALALGAWIWLRDPPPEHVDPPRIAHVEAPVRPPRRSTRESGGEDAPPPPPQPTPIAPALPSKPPAPPPVPKAAAPTHTGPASYIFPRIGKSLGSDKLKDVSKGRPYKVNLYQDSGFSTVNRAKVDLDRDDKWDEKWTFKEGSISRQIAPADDEVYTVTEVWTGEAWTRE